MHIYEKEILDYITLCSLTALKFSLCQNMKNGFLCDIRMCVMLTVMFLSNYKHVSYKFNYDVQCDLILTAN